MDGRRAQGVLGVNADAGPEDIRRAFRARALHTHPDHGGTAEAFAETMTAFAVLRDTVARRRTILRRRVDVYDSMRPAPQRNFADILHAALGRL